ncbi:MAG: tetratricopeptide repeat protein [Planctomycetota bacterium]|nr:MAG: tetratricopeptide repeat protein [Planctomycetota bacterium]
MIAALLLALAQSPAQAPAPTPAELWNAGRRAEAIARLDAGLAASRDPAADRVQLARWELELTRYEAGLKHLEGLGPEWNKLRGELNYRAHHYEPALALLDPADREHCLWIVDALEALERFDEADAALERAAALRGADDARVQSQRGRAYARDGRWKEALPCFEKAHAADALDAQALFGLGQALVRTGEEPRGLQLLDSHSKLLPLLDRLQFAQQGLALEPLSAPNHAAIGDVERDLARLVPARRERAAAAYERALELAPNEQLVPIALRAARCYDEDFREPERAVALLVNCERRVADPRLAVRAGDLLAKAGRRDDALAAYRRGLALRPNDAQIRARLAKLESAASQPTGGGR